MTFTDLHFELHVRDLSAAKRFYVDQLGLPILQETKAMNLLAVRVGKSRMSLFGNRTEGGGEGPSQIILAVENIEEAVAELEERGVAVSGPPVSAGSFLRFVTTLDSDGTPWRSPNISAIRPSRFNQSKLFSKRERRAAAVR